MSGLYYKSLDRIRWQIALVKLATDEILAISVRNGGQIVFEVTPAAASRSFRKQLTPGISFDIEYSESHFSLITFNAGKVRWESKVPVDEVQAWIKSLEVPVDDKPKRTRKQLAAMDKIAQENMPRGNQ